MLPRQNMIEEENTKPVKTCAVGVSVEAETASSVQQILWDELYPSVHPLHPPSHRFPTNDFFPHGQYLAC